MREIIYDGNATLAAVMREKAETAAQHAADAATRQELLLTQIAASLSLLTRPSQMEPNTEPFRRTPQPGPDRVPPNRQLADEAERRAEEAYSGRRLRPGWPRQTMHVSASSSSVARRNPLLIKDLPPATSANRGHLTESVWQTYLSKEDINEVASLRGAALTALAELAR